MTLIAFLPILWGLSAYVTELPIVGEMPQALVFVAIVWSVFGTGLLALAGIRLPGLEFRNQRVEAAYRKELVFGEDNADRAQPPTLAELFDDVRRNYFRIYFNYLYFNVVRYGYLQASVLVPYIALAPSIVAGGFTLGVMQQILRAFGRVRVLVPVPRQLVDDDRRADLDLQAPAGLRGDAPRRAAVGHREGGDAAAGAAHGDAGVGGGIACDRSMPAMELVSTRAARGSARSRDRGVIQVQPCSMASAAYQASLTSAPVVGVSVQSRSKMSQ